MLTSVPLTLTSTTTMSFNATAQEQQLIKTVLSKADTQDLGVVTGDEAVKIFAGSGLPPTILGEIWQLSDSENNGFLTDHGLGIALRLIGWAQAGEKPKNELIARVGPLPTLKGIPIPGVSSNPGSPIPLPAPSLPARPVMPPLTPDDRQKFLRMFFQSGPSNGMLSGEKARDLFLKSKLPTDKLGQIWHLADTHERGSLDATDFVIGMFLIQSVMSGALQMIPPSLPPSLYEQASGGASRPGVGSPLQSQFTGNSTGSRPSTSIAQRAASPIRAQFTGQAPLEPQYTGGQQRRIAPQYTGQSQFSLNPAPATTPALRPQITGQPFAMPQPFALPKWDVTAEEKVKSDTFFATLDPQGRGFIEGDVAVQFMVQSQLPEAVLAQVWDLSDLNKDGKLTRDGFAVAMHLINGKLAGREIPTELPSTLIPPSFRLGSNGASTTSPVSTAPAQSETLRDLWSIDEPVHTPTPPVQSPSKVTSPAPKPPVQAPKPTRNLFDDDEDDVPASHASATSPAPAPATATQSIEIANVQNQLSSTQRALESATAARTAASTSAESAAAELAQLQAQLARASAARASEETHLAEVRARKVQQDADLAKTREELIRAESEASAVRLERGEIEGGVLRDKEELRGVQKKVLEVAEEGEKMKAELEKIKREARQVKGMLAIARKQLATGEGEKAKIRAEMDEARAEVESTQKELEDVEKQVAEGQHTPATEIVSPAPVSVPTLNGLGSPPRADTLSPTQVELPISRSVTPAGPGVPQRSGSTNPFDRLRGATGTSSPALPFTDVPSAASPFIGSPASPGPFGAASAPFGAPTTSSFDAAFGETASNSPFGASPIAETHFTDTVDPAKAIEQTKPQLQPPAPVSEPGTHALADDEDPFGMSSDDAVFDKGKGKEVEDHAKVDETNDISETERTPVVEAEKSATGLDKSKTEDDPEIAAAVSQFPALSLENSPAPAPASALTAAAPVQANDDLPPLTELTTADDSTDEDSDDEPLDKKAKRLTSQSPKPAPTPASAPAPAPAASAGGASAFDDAFGLPPNSTTPAAAGVNAFDETLKTIPSNNGEPAKSAFSFENSFEDNFDFPSNFTNSNAEPVQPKAINTGVDAFTPVTQSTVSPTVPGAFSFDDAFGGSSVTSNGKAGSNPPSKGVSFDDAFGLSGSAPASVKPETGSKQPSFDAFGAAFSAPKSTTTSTIPAPEPVPIPTPVSVPAPSASTISRPSPPTSPTSNSMHSGRASSPRNKRSESPKAQPRPRLEPPAEPAQRHSKLSLHFPSFGRSKTTKDKNRGKKDKGAREAIPDVPPAASSSLLASPPIPGNGTSTPAVEDDVEAVKTLCGMGFSRTQAVNALETHGYDVQKALNSLLGS